MDPPFLSRFGVGKPLWACLAEYVRMVVHCRARSELIFYDEAWAHTEERPPIKPDATDPKRVSSVRRDG
jgi:hypothetical protein